jgi:hypothetical protein
VEGLDTIELPGLGFGMAWAPLGFEPEKFLSRGSTGMSGDEGGTVLLERTKESTVMGRSTR